MESQQVITKVLVPGRRSNLLHRPRLINFLHEHIERKLLLVSASAGYGKTSLLVDFAHETTLPVCWYSLDASDSDPKIFLEYIVTSLRRQFPGFGSRTLGLLLDAALLRDAQVVVGTLVTEIFETIPGYFVLILDDYQTVENSEPINTILDTLLRLLPENAHILLASRTLPSKLTLTRLTARQEIAGLGVNDLRFDAGEVQSLVAQNYGFALSDEQAAALAEHSEGWITGILLTTHSLWKGLFKDLVRVKGSRSHVFAYLAGEVFEQQPQDLKRFLLDSSLLAQMEPEICDELFGIANSAELLRLLEQKNLFIVRLEESETWYRYHHLFQEFLQARLDETDPSRARSLHERAATLFESRCVWDQAIHHYLKTGLDEQAARVIEQVAKPTFDAGHWTTLSQWIDALTRERLDAHPYLLVTRASILNDTGQSPAAVEMYSQALASFERLGNRNGMGRALVKQASCWRMKGQYQDAIMNSQRALALLDEQAQVDIAEAHRTIGICFGMLGDWNKCVPELETAAALYIALNDFANVARVHQDLGVAYRTNGNPGADRHFQLAIESWERAGNKAGMANTLNSIGISRHRQGDYALAIETLRQAHTLAHESGQLRIEAFALASLGDVYRDQGEYANAQGAYQSAYAIAQRIDEGFVITFTLCALGETFRLSGDLITADRLLRQALEQASGHHSSYEIGLTLTARGILALVQGDLRVAEDNLEQAVDIFEKGGAKRENARARLHLANVNLSQRKYKRAASHLKIVAEIGQQLRQDQFIIAEWGQLGFPVKYAISKKIGNMYFASVLEKTEKLAIQSRQAPQFQPVEVSRVFQVNAFGSGSVLLDGKLVTKTDWDSAASKELFFFLLAHPQGLRKEQILSTLWGDTPPAKANGIFHSTAWRMRRALIPECLVYENGLYRISQEISLEYDVDQFTTCLEQAEAAREEQAAQARQKAVALYRGDYLEEIYDDWCSPIRTLLEDRYMAALLWLVHYHSQRSEREQAERLCRRILEKDPYREDVFRELMRLQARDGNPAAALKTYQECVEILAEAKLKPSSETRSLAERIMAGDQV